MWHPKSEQRVARLQRLEDASGDKYCHAHLVMLGMLKHETGDDLESEKESARNTWMCQKERDDLGSCWCRKFSKEPLGALEGQADG